MRNQMTWACVHAVLTMAAANAQPQHVNLQSVKQLLARSQTESIGIVLYGDSRSSWTRHRVPGGIFRQWDVQWGALAFEGNQGNNGTEDGLGEMLMGLEGVDTSVTGPGGIVPAAGWTNRFPNSIAEQSVRPNTDLRLWTNFMAVLSSTAGGPMHSNAQGAPGGTFRRGDPAQGRAVESVEYFAIADQSGHSLGVQFGLDRDGDIYMPWLASAEFEPPVSTSSLPQIVTRSFAAGVSGSNLRLVMAHRFAEAGLYAGKRNDWIGTRINFAGQVGCVLGVVAQGGWSITDHLPPSVDATNDNPDWKYGEAETAQWYAATIRCPRVLLRWEVGANPATGQAYEASIAERKRIARLAIDRNIAALRAGGAQEVIVELVPYYGSPGDPGGPASRVEQNRTAMRELATEEGWAFYDQVGVLQAGGYTNNSPVGVTLAPAWTEDGVHQSFAGMNLLQSLEWTQIEATTPPCFTSDFNQDGDSGTDQDVEAFFACLAGACCAACPPDGADFNRDSHFGTDQDIESFFRVLGGGSCY